MGVQGFSELLKARAPQSTRPLPLSQMRGYIIAIDMNWLTHKEFSVAFDIATRDIDLITQPVDNNMVMNITVEHVIQRILKFLQLGITTVCVFDGPKHWLKTDQYCNPKRVEERQKRRETYEQLHQAYQTLGPFGMDLKQLASYEKAIKANYPFDFTIYQHLETILRAFGVPVVKSDQILIETNDAEGVCAYLCRFHGCTMSYTSDTDYHVYGGEWQITDIDNGVCTVRCLSDILLQLDVSYLQLVDICILMGNDFNARLPRKTGPSKSYDEIKTKGSFLNSRFANEPVFHWYHYIVNLYTSATQVAASDTPNIVTTMQWQCLTTAHENPIVQYFQLSNYAPRFQACQQLF